MKTKEYRFKLIDPSWDPDKLAFNAEMNPDEYMREVERIDIDKIASTKQAYAMAVSSLTIGAVGKAKEYFEISLAQTFPRSRGVAFFYTKVLYSLGEEERAKEILLSLADESVNDEYGMEAVKALKTLYGVNY
ncbi:MAG: hypothetical protein C0609_08010 [Deltaproteobacteria bacterium]|nr:MAG: hypothetical protein C0609_08010 [Deltaproteobacteria bacterium]